jgi:hypothetical protein
MNGFTVTPLKNNSALTMDNPFFEAGTPEYDDVLMVSFYESPVDVGNGLRIWGDDVGTRIAVRSNSEVISLDQESNQFIRLVNTSPASFERCFRAYKAYAAQVSQFKSEAEQLECVKKLEMKLLQCDSKAMKDKNSWWSSILAQAYEGNL